MGEGEIHATFEYLGQPDVLRAGAGGAMNEAMIQLMPNHRFAGGYHRDCYVHPADQSLCIKVSLRGNLRESTREAKYYRHLQRRHVPWDLLPRFHGFVETSLGPGAIFDLVRDDDGKVSATLEHYLRSPPATAANRDGLTLALRSLRAGLLEHRIITRTLKTKNIVYQKTGPETGRLVIIDNIGNTEYFPIGNYIGIFARRKIMRKWARFERDVVKNFKDNDLTSAVPSGGWPKELP